MCLSATQTHLHMLVAPYWSVAVQVSLLEYTGKSSFIYENHAQNWSLEMVIYLSRIEDQTTYVWTAQLQVYTALNTLRPSLQITYLIYCGLGFGFLMLIQVRVVRTAF